jgi:integration host factor subunit alpha
MSPASNLKTPSQPSFRKPKALVLKAARNEPRPQGALTRQDMALAIANMCGNISKREAKRLVDSVIDEFVRTLTRGENLKLHDFGSFIVRGKGERAGRNPRTGAKVPIEPRQVIVFKASPNMKAIVNGGAETNSGGVLRVVGKSARPGATK